MYILTDKIQKENFKKGTIILNNKRNMFYKKKLLIMYKVTNLHQKTSKQSINNQVKDQKNNHLDSIQQK